MNLSSYRLLFICIFSLFLVITGDVMGDIRGFDRTAFQGKGASSGKIIYITFLPEQNNLSIQINDNDPETSIYLANTVDELIDPTMPEEMVIFWPDLFGYAMRIAGKDHSGHDHHKIFEIMDSDAPIFSSVIGKKFKYKSYFRLKVPSGIAARLVSLEARRLVFEEVNTIYGQPVQILIDLYPIDGEYTIQAIFIVRGDKIIDGFELEEWQRYKQKLQDPSLHPDIDKYPPTPKDDSNNSKKDPSCQSKSTEKKKRSQFHYQGGNGGGVCSLNKWLIINLQNETYISDHGMILHNFIFPLQK